MSVPVDEWIKGDQWRALKPPITSSLEARRELPLPQRLEVMDQVVRQFRVMEAKRYARRWNPRTKRWETFCNIYSWDLSSALGCEIPHWVERDGKRVELNANDTYDWLIDRAALEVAGSWWIAKIETAIAHANAGKPCFASWKNPRPDESGHIAMLRAQLKQPSPIPVSTQAGAVNYAYAPLSLGFGSKPVTFFCHP